MAKGNLFVISAASGTGKTTLIHSVLKMLHKTRMSISYTTRPKRPEEKDGVDYYFVDQQKFDEMVENNEFLEYAHVFDHNYGTARSVTEELLGQGIDVILEIEWKGTQQVLDKIKDTVTIFVLPPSFEDLKQRIFDRDQDHQDVIQKRLDSARNEISHCKHYNYLIVNDQFDRAIEELKSILVAERCRCKRQQEDLSTLLKSFE